MQQCPIYVDPEFRTRLATDSRLALAPCWEIHESFDSYPKPTRDVLLLLASMGWDCTVDRFENLVASGDLKQPPEKINGRYAWHASDIARLIHALDKQRAWLIGFHADMKTPEELAADEAEAAKGMQMLQYYQRMPAEELQARLAETRTSPTRELLSAALRLQQEA